MSGSAAAKSYINTTSMIFIGGFMMALAMERWLLHQRVALKILILTKKITRLPLILLGFMATSYLLSMWLSNTATALIMCPNAGAVVRRLRNLILNDKEELDQEESERRSKAIHRLEVAIFLGIAYSCNIGGIATLVGTPGNLIFVEQYEIIFGKKYSSPSSLQWFGLGIPISLLFIVFLYFYFLLYIRSTINIMRDFTKQKCGGVSLESVTSSAVDGDSADDDHVLQDIPNSSQPVDLGMTVFQTEYNQMGPILYEEVVIVVLFSLMVVLWMTRQFWQLIPIFKTKYIDDGTVAIMVAVLLFLIPSKNKPPTDDQDQSGSIMSWQTMKGFPWDIILIFGGGFIISNGFQDSTLTQLIAKKISCPEWLPTYYSYACDKYCCYFYYGSVQ
ncbi:hypothetical protein AKO1_013601 [Acrasis kona]|uniref:Uncharacterized protein n=1 Tax=Acrasis kona TaxID=1008807 RepID=A0AAW2YXF9_9EUKA